MSNKEKNKKPYLPIYEDQYKVLKLMTIEDIGTAVLYAMKYVATGEETEDLDGMSGVLYTILINQYIRRREDAENGSKGGRPRKEPEIDGEENFDDSEETLPF